MAKKAAVKKSSPKKVAAKKSAKKATGSTKWTCDAIIAQLRELGNEKMRTAGARQGIQGEQFGVKNGDIRAIADKIKTNHALALELWKTRIHEAQMLATLLFKSAEFTEDSLDKLVRSCANVLVADWLHSHVTKEHPGKEALRVKWMKCEHPMTGRAGWRLTAGRVAKDPDGLDLSGLLDRIEKEMAGQVAEIQWTMNACLAEIGINHPQLRKRAVSIGEKLGIYRDYPVSKGCTSPFAPIWIEAMVKRAK
ncbi:MAG: DNA alkylation repair protein [Pirellulales bacterium]